VTTRGNGDEVSHSEATMMKPMAMALKMARSMTMSMALCAMAVPALAQTPPAGAKPAGPRQGGGPAMPDPLVLDEHTGFESIFDGTTLKGWDGDPDAWRAENGVLIGESTAEKPLKANTFIVWRGGQPKDFELKLEYRLNSTNSGVQYRSADAPDIGKWVLKGYQADIDFDNRYTGQLYEERGRGFLALRGQSTYIPSGQKPRIIGTLESGDALKAFIKTDDWNQLHIIARGRTLIHILNGHVMSVVVDDDTAKGAASGLIGFQMHVGPPMKVQFRNIWLKNVS
jgi:Domain of Unknown Function (DUF1080)